jgi:hypothetical protein
VTPSPGARRTIAQNGPGLAASTLLHGVILLLILFWIRQAAQPERETAVPLTVDIVHLGEETTSPSVRQKAANASEQATVRRAAAAHSPPTVSPTAKAQPRDDLQNRLNALAKLREPETAARAMTGAGESPEPTAGNDAPPGDASYALRDFIRAQVERRWSLDLGLLGAQKIVVALHVVMKANGTIALAEIVDKQRYKTDAVYRRVAMSARNAVLLASPIALPAGNYPAETELTLHLDPRDALR